MKIYSWQPVLTDHQSHTLAALRDTAHAELGVFVTRAEHDVRKQQGWTSPHAATLRPTVLPRFTWWLRAWRLIASDADAIHLFGSPFEDLKLIAVLVAALLLNRRVYLISEPYAPTGIVYLEDRAQLVANVKSTLRPFAYRAYGCLIRRRIAGVFAISRAAIAQYMTVGVPRSRLWPFGYFVPARDTEVEIEPKHSVSLRAVFVGSLIRRKGLDILLSAVQGAVSSGVRMQLDVYGPGNPTGYDFGEASTYKGRLEFGAAQRVIGEYDLLVVPSRFDGWGVVVNEALLAGVPVVCSDAVGAAALIEKWDCGAIYHRDDASGLAALLRKFAASPNLLEDAKRHARQAAAVILPSTAGKYMADVIASDIYPHRARPSAPWYVP